MEILLTFLVLIFFFADFDRSKKRSEHSIEALPWAIWSTYRKLLSVDGNLDAGPPLLHPLIFSIVFSFSKRIAFRRRWIYFKNFDDSRVRTLTYMYNLQCFNVSGGARIRKQQYTKISIFLVYYFYANLEMSFFQLTDNHKKS